MVLVRKSDTPEGRSTERSEGEADKSYSFEPAGPPRWKALAPVTGLRFGVFGK
jgi:hypothetical protein